VKRALLQFLVAAALTVPAHAGVKLLNGPPLVVNINTATETQLMYLPHVGAATAAWIHSYMIDRETRGGPHFQFTSIEQLREVTNGPDGKGRHLISARALDDMRPYVTLSGPTTARAKIKVRK
jgi:DNA uptake protein ComE-like DNA-binding protein